jgi:hypothetical protein
MLGTFFQNIFGSLPLGLTCEIVLAHTTGVIAILVLFRFAFIHLKRWIYALVAANVISLVIFNDLLISYFHGRVIDLLPRVLGTSPLLIAAVTLSSIAAAFSFSLYLINPKRNMKRSITR